MHDDYDDDELLALARFDLGRERPDEALWKLKKLINTSEPSPDVVVLAARLYAVAMPLLPGALNKPLRPMS